MSIEFACHACGKPMNVQSADQAGSVIKCPACGEPVVVPKPDAAPPAETARGFPVKAIALAEGGVLILAVVLFFVLGGKSTPDKSGKSALVSGAAGVAFGKAAIAAALAV